MTAPSPHLDAGADLARWARERDRAALDRLVAASLDRAYTQARRLLGNEADARDATQEAVLQLMRSAHRYDPARPFAPWLARHVHDACLRLLRSERRRSRRERGIAAPPPAPEPVDAEAVRSAVADLPERDRAAIDLHYFAGLTQADASSELGISENAFAVRLHRARERLRSLLQRRGIAAGAAGVLAALLAPPAYSAPASVLAAAQALAGAGALPATTIPISAVQHALGAVIRHPVASLVAALALVAAALAPFARPAGAAPAVVVHAEPAPVPAPVAPDCWREPARGLLAWLDPAADFQLAVDGDSLRRLAATTKPTSLLADRRCATALARLDHQLDLLEAWGDPHYVAINSRVIMAAPALVVALQSDGATHRPIEDRWLAILHAGRAADRVRRMITGDPYWAAGQPASVGGFAGRVGKGLPLVGFAGEQIALAAPDWLGRRAAAVAGATPTPAQLRAPAWLRFDAGPVLAAYAAHDRDGSDPMRLELLLGPGWRRLKPRVEVTLAVADGAWRADGAIDGAMPLSPFLALNLMEAQVSLGLPEAVSWLSTLPLRAPDPALVPPPAPGAVLRLTLGCSPGTLPAAAQEGLVRLLGAAAPVAALWTGDAAVEVVGAAPLPTVSLVLGRRPDGDAGALAALLAGLGAETAPPPPGAEAAWTLASPVGPVRVLLARDRLVATTGADTKRLLARGTAAIAAHLTLDVDLPAIGRAWLPMVFGPLVRGQVPLGLDRQFVSLSAAGSETAQAVLKRGVTDMEQALPLAWRTGLAPLAAGAGGFAHRFALYVPSTGTIDERSLDFRWVWRDQLGFHLAVLGDQGFDRAMDQAGLDRALAGRVRLLGDAPADLVAFPERPDLDGRCLPPLAAVLDHLPEYHLAWSSTADGARFEERGLPLAAGLVGFASGTVAVESDPEHEHVQATDFDSLRTAFAVHAAELRALAGIAGSWGATLPERPSRSAVAGGLAAFAPLFGGRTPTAAEVDGLGTWFGDSGPQRTATIAVSEEGLRNGVEVLSGPAVWSVPLGDGWTAQVYHGTVVGLSRDEEQGPAAPVNSF